MRPSATSDETRGCRSRFSMLSEKSRWREKKRRTEGKWTRRNEPIDNAEARPDLMISYAY